jgi:CBS domain-containing protein
MKNSFTTLETATAVDLMTANPLSINADATVKEAVAFLTDKGFSGAPVIDHAGRPVGVLSRADIIVHDREKVEYVAAVPDYYEAAERLAAPSGESLYDGFQVENIDWTPVRDIMTPVVFSVAPDTPASKVIEQMVTLKVHRLFVIGSGGVLVGVISALDVLRYLHGQLQAALEAPGGRFHRGR